MSLHSSQTRRCRRVQQSRELTELPGNAFAFPTLSMEAQHSRGITKARLGADLSLCLIPLCQKTNKSHQELAKV